MTKKSFARLVRGCTDPENSIQVLTVDKAAIYLDRKLQSKYLIDVDKGSISRINEDLKSWVLNFDFQGMIPKVYYTRKHLNQLIQFIKKSYRIHLNEQEV